jgi:transglutaminase-like putative cysteine protease
MATELYPPLDSAFLLPSPIIESDHPAIANFVSEQGTPSDSPTQNAVQLFYAVRDRIRYNPYRVDLSVAGIKASTTLQLGQGWCIPKAVLLAACCRAIGIPARLGFADVRNHLASEQLIRRMGTDIFYWHAWTEMWLMDHWVKATPAMNAAFCRRFGTQPLEFDGQTDALYQPFDSQGERYMNYVRDRGSYADVPLTDITQTFHAHYGTAPISTFISRTTIA